MKIAFAFLLSMPGAPFIYYGDEIGLRYVEGLTSVEGGYGRTGSRSPMQWDKTPNAGFSSAPTEKLYVRQDDAPDRPDAASQCADEMSLRSEVKRLIALRMAHPALQSKGTVSFLSDNYPLAYVRSSAEESILVIINPSAAPAILSAEELCALNKELLYTVGGTVKENADHALQVDGGTAAFISLTK